MSVKIGREGHFLLTSNSFIRAPLISCRCLEARWPRMSTTEFILGTFSSPLTSISGRLFPCWQKSLRPHISTLVIIVFGKQDLKIVSFQMKCFNKMIHWHFGAIHQFSQTFIYYVKFCTQYVQPPNQNVDCIWQRLLIMHLHIHQGHC